MAAAAVAATTHFARVSSQADRRGVEVSSPSGLRERPENLVKVPAGTDRRNADSIGPIPTDIIYGQIFRHIEELERKAEAEEHEGKDGRKIRDFDKDKARLTESQARTLDRIARETNVALKQIDARARALIAETRAKTPNRRLEFGDVIPPPPAELGELAGRRRELILKSVEDLRREFGEAEFLKFTIFVDTDVRPGIRRLEKPEGGLLR